MFVVWVRGIYIISITKGAGRRSTRRHPEISKKKRSHVWERHLELGGSALKSAAWATRLTTVTNVPRDHDGLQ